MYLKSEKIPRLTLHYTIAININDIIESKNFPLSFNSASMSGQSSDVSALFM